MKKCFDPLAGEGQSMLRSASPGRPMDISQFQHKSLEEPREKQIRPILHDYSGEKLAFFPDLPSSEVIEWLPSPQAVVQPVVLFPAKNLVLRCHVQLFTCFFSVNLDFMWIAQESSAIKQTLFNLFDKPS